MGGTQDSQPQKQGNPLSFPRPTPNDSVITPMVIRPEEPQSCGTGGYDPWSEPYFGVAFAPPQEDPMFKDLLNPIDVLLRVAYPPEEDPPEPEVNPLDVYCGTSFNGAQTGCSTTTVNEYSPPRRDTSASLSYQGVNWFQNSRPELRKWTDESGVVRLYIILSARRYLEFVRAKDGSTTSSNMWVGTNGTVGAVRWTPDTSSLPGIFEWHDSRGYVWTFFDDDGNAHGAAGHLWKVASADGSGTHSSVLYTGHETNISTALSSGFVQTGSPAEPTYKPALVYDRSDRKISYTYSGNQLVTIKWETLDTTPVLLRQVDFTYYSSSLNTNDANHGSDGDLKFIKTTVPQSSGGSIEYVKYFRYYVGTYGESNRGHLHKMKLSMSAEAVRRYDLVDTTAGDYEADLDAEDDDDLRPYSSRFFQYDDHAQQRPYRMYVNGLCGCGSSSGGWYEFSYDDNTAFDSTINTNGYTRQDDWGYQYWASRAMMTRPDGSTVTAYFDEVGQLLGVVRCSGSPTGSGVTFWITKYERDERGRVTRVFTPEAVNTSAYRHVTSGSDKAGTIQTNASDGLVYTWTYYDPGSGNQNYLPTAVTKREHSKGRTGTKYTDWTVEYASPSNSTYWRYKDVRYGTEAAYARLATPLPTKIRAYHNEVNGAGSASDYDEISFAYTFHQVSSSDTWLVKKKTITHTAVPLANNGSDSAVSRAKYYRRDGRLAFDESASGVFTYYDYAVSGKLMRRIVDAKSGTSDSALNDAATAVGASLPSTGVPLTTAYSYDGQDRLIGVTDPSNRESVYHYTKLADGRRVRLTVPKKDGSTFYGPASYAVLNQAGKTEAQGVIAFSGTTSGFTGTTTTAIASWIDEADSDPIDAVAHGTLSRLSVNIYNETGGRATTSRTYFTVPTSLPGSPASSYYDESQYTYDNVGRVARVIDPSGTRTRWVYDQRDRVTQRWVGTAEPTTGSFDANPSTLNVGDYALVELYEYDGGSTGNNHLTKKQQDVDGDSTTSTDRRTTSYTYDYRGRIIIQENPLAPHALFKYDNRDRAIASATLSSLSGVTITSNPTASSFSNRLSLSETSYDARGQVYRTVRHKINQSTGGITSGEELTTNNWYDKDMRLIKTQGSSLTKYKYDRLGRRTHTFVLAKIDDTEANSTITTDDYDAAGTLAGDIVLEEHQTIYEDATSNVLFTASLSRHHDASTTADGPLDYNQDGGTGGAGSGSPLTLTANDLRVGGSSSAAILARAQITATWYDVLDRPIHTAQYGTYGLNESGDCAHTSFARSGMGTPTRDNCTLVTSTTYNTDGTVLEVEAPGKPSAPTGTAGTKTQYLYDKAARQVAVISNYTGGSLSNDDRATDTYVRYAYTTGLMTAMWVDIQGDDTDGVPPSSLSGADAKDQITKYVYGTTRGSTPGSGTPPSPRSPPATSCARPSTPRRPPARPNPRAPSSTPTTPSPSRSGPRTRTAPSSPPPSTPPAARPPASPTPSAPTSTPPSAASTSPTPAAARFSPSINTAPPPAPPAPSTASSTPTTIGATSRASPRTATVRLPRRAATSIPWRSITREEHLITADSPIAARR
jgi:YD repeat-containing protein